MVSCVNLIQSVEWTVHGEAIMPARADYYI